MPVTFSAKKTLRKDRRRTIVNNRIKRQIKTVLKEARKKPSPKKFSLVARTLDRATKKRIIHKNTAARLKSRFSKLLKPAKK